MKKTLTTVLLTLVVLCMAGGAMAEAVKIGASPTPHAQVLTEALVPLLAEKGFEVEVVEFTDYVQPNLATESGDLNANYFQHKLYMDDFNAQNDTHMVAAIPVHFEPMAIYSDKITSLDEIADGATVSLPNDTSNCARALLLLEANGLIKLKEGAGVLATELDIEENPKNLKVLPIEAAQLPLRLADVDFSVINGNYALQAELTNPIAQEDAETINEGYINYIVVKEGNEEGDLVKAIREALADPSVKTYFEETFGAAVLPAF